MAHFERHHIKWGQQDFSGFRFAHGSGGFILWSQMGHFIKVDDPNEYFNVVPASMGVDHQGLSDVITALGSLIMIKGRDLIFKRDHIFRRNGARLYCAEFLTPPLWKVSAYFPLHLLGVVRDPASKKTILAHLVISEGWGGGVLPGSYRLKEHTLRVMSEEPDVSFKTFLFGEQIMVIESSALGDKAIIFSYFGQLLDTFKLSERVLGGCQITVEGQSFIALLLSENSLIIYGNGEILVHSQISVNGQLLCIGFSPKTSELLFGGTNGLHRIRFLL